MSSTSVSKSVDKNFSKATVSEKKEPANKRAVRKQVAQKKAWHKGFPAKKRPKAKHSCKSTLESWKLVEKKCLLEGLKTYGPQKIKLIANLIGSKSEAEVQERIFSLRGAAACDTQNADGINTEARAPIEKWIYNIGELVNFDDKDCSQEISKALAYIAKHEHFNENQVTDLSWRDIYTYLSGLAENRSVGLPILSDIESTIVLELMTDLGTTLNKFNTTSQRQILEHKIQLINAGHGVTCSTRAQRAQCAMLLVNALGNDFTGLEDILIDSTSGSALSSKPSDSKSSSESFSESTGFTEKDALASHSNIAYCVNSSNLVSKGEVDVGEHVVLKWSDVLDKTFIKPKLFTLNPLCIPTKLLNFQPKNVQ